MTHWRKEMSRHRQFTLATNVQVFFCDPHSHDSGGQTKTKHGWLAAPVLPEEHRPEYLQPRRPDGGSRPAQQQAAETLDWDTPAERLNKLLELAA
jgi:hypothetical protein